VVVFTLDGPIGRILSNNFHDDLSNYNDYQKRDAYCLKMIRGRGWATTCEIIAAAKFLNCKIHVWSRIHDRNSEHEQPRHMLSVYDEGVSDDAPTIQILHDRFHFY
jgi:hypothetical protein